MEKSGEHFQEMTKYTREGLGMSAPDRTQRPGFYKTFPEAPRIALPAPIISEGPCLSRILQKRHSIRRYSERPLSLDEISHLLWAMGGINRVERGYEFRTAPSAGALYPIETYIVANRIDGLEPGVYHYSVKDHTLELLKKGDFGTETARAALDQGMCAEAPVVFIWTAIFARSRWKYAQRAYRYVYLDAGHMAQNLALAATSLDLGTCQIAALFDEEVNTIVGADGQQESTVYMSVAGRP
ncbi:MAG TPA: SagB/ThcOx family dehydrogenase [Candidatus Sumerlaeota bacterium]|nr:SagB/ThcOx family dehydrogenase [Candidatus Sumerlaeota bacterium]